MIHNSATNSILIQHNQTTRQVTLVEQKLLTFPMHMSASPAFSGVRIALSFVFCIMFWKSLFVLFFSFSLGHGLGTPSIYGFRLHLWICFLLNNSNLRFAYKQIQLAFPLKQYYNHLFFPYFPRSHLITKMHLVSPLRSDTSCSSNTLRKHKASLPR